MSFVKYCQSTRYFRSDIQQIHILVLQCTRSGRPRKSPQRSPLHEFDDLELIR